MPTKQDLINKATTILATINAKNYKAEAIKNIDQLLANIDTFLNQTYIQE